MADEGGPINPMDRVLRDLSSGYDRQLKHRPIRPCWHDVGPHVDTDLSSHAWGPIQGVRHGMPVKWRPPELVDPQWECLDAGPLNCTLLTTILLMSTGPGSTQVRSSFKLGWRFNGRITKPWSTSSPPGSMGGTWRRVVFLSCAIPPNLMGWRSSIWQEAGNGAHYSGSQQNDARMPWFLFFLFFLLFCWGWWASFCWLLFLAVACQNHPFLLEEAGVFLELTFFPPQEMSARTSKFRV